MYIYSVERLGPQLVSEMESIFQAYYYDTPAHMDIPPYDFDWDTYYKLDEAGILLITTAREAGELVGFTLYVILTAPHHKTVKVAMCDGISTSPGHRGRGMGKALYIYTESILRELGVHRVTNHHRVCYGTKSMFDGLGFKLIEHVYMKEIG